MSEEHLRKQSILSLRAIVTKHKLLTIGSKVEIITMIMVEVKNPTKDRVDVGILKEALIRWQQLVQFFNNNEITNFRNEIGTG